jgi:hypothetical protein
MASENKTQPTSMSVEAFLNSLADETRRKDCFTLLALMHDITGEPAVMWGDAQVGFGKYHYRYASGREGDSFLAGFSPRKQNLTIYVVAYVERYESLLSQLGRCKTAKSCLYINKLADIDLNVLREILKQSVEYMRQLYPG